MKVEVRQHLGLCPLGCSKFACGLTRVRPRSSSSGGRCCCRRERSKGRSSKSFSSRKKGVLAMTLNCRTWVWLLRPVLFSFCCLKSSIPFFNFCDHRCARLHPDSTCLSTSRCGFSLIMPVLVFITAKVLSYQALSRGHLCPCALLFGGASFLHISSVWDCLFMCFALNSLCACCATFAPICLLFRDTISCIL